VGAKALEKIQRDDLPVLVRVLGGSTYLSDILFPREKADRFSFFSSYTPRTKITVAQLGATYYRILTKMNKSEKKSSTSMRLESSAGSSCRFNRELTPQIRQELAPSHVAPELQAAQKLLARIAIKILTHERQQADEKQRTDKADSPIDHT
jgi:hypothetical protein